MKNVAAPTPDLDPNYGEVFTRRWVVDAMLDLAGYRATEDLAARTVVEPSIGSGAFWVPIVERLVTSALAHGRDFAELADCLRGFDLQTIHVDTCRKESVDVLTGAGCDSETADRLATTWLRATDFLLDDEPLEADLVIGNPPYIRWDDLTPAVAATYRHLWRTMQGRVDIYVGFYERGLSILKPSGKLSFICADRWMRNAYGAGLRAFVTRHFAVEHVWQMHDVDAFESEVSAYPAIVQIGATSQGPVVVADCGAGFVGADAQELVAFDHGSTLTTDTFAAHRVEGWFSGADLWPAGSPDRIALIEYLNENFPPLEETGVKVGIGIATGADKSYIAPQDVDVEPDRKLPITMTNDVRAGSFKWGGKVLLNPWTESGKLVDLADYPKLRAFFENQPALRNRFVAKKNPAGWYRTIDKVTASLTARPKLLLQDMKAAITPVYEPGGHYPHHNLYYMVSEDWDLKVLGGLMLSRVAQAFIEAYGVRMRGGTLRFQSQYLRKIRVPRPSDIAPELQAELRASFEANDRDRATRAAERAYGLPVGAL